MTHLTLHASCVAVDGQAVVILGPSGAGKSALALRLIAFGALLVADDRTALSVINGALIATRPDNLPAWIEARGVGLLNAPILDRASVRLVVDLTTPETNRLPPHRQITFLGICCDLVLGSQSDHFPASVLCYLKYGRGA